MEKMNLSKTVLDMRFMKKTKIEMQKREEDTKNIDDLTSSVIKEGRNCNYVLERSWELLLDLKSPRLNYGMGQENAKKVAVATVEEKPDESRSEVNSEEKREQSQQPPRKKHRKH